MLAWKPRQVDARQADRAAGCETEPAVVGPDPHRRQAGNEYEMRKVGELRVEGSAASGAPATIIRGSRAYRVHRNRVTTTLTTRENLETKSRASKYLAL